MKTKQTLLALAAATVFAGGVTYAQPNANTRGPRGANADRAAMAAERERIVAIYDEDGDGKLDAVEREVLFEDIESGAIAPPGFASGRGRPGAHGPKGPPAEIVDQYDTDGDGVLSATEREALHADIEAGVVELPQRGGPPQEIVDQFDANGDGELDADERAALHAAIESGEVSPPGGRSGRKGGGRGGPPQEIIDQYDANGDGVLDADEHAAVKADIESGKLTPPAVHPGVAGRGTAGGRRGGPQG